MIRLKDKEFHAPFETGDSK